MVNMGLPKGQARSDGALMDIAPTLAGVVPEWDGDGMVGLFVMGLGVLVWGVVGAGHPAAGQADHKGRPAVRAVPAVPAVIQQGRDRLEPVEVLTVRR